jgi:carboxyl-terminal processing protease
MAALARAFVCLVLPALVGCGDLGGPWTGGIGAVLRHRAHDSTLLVHDVPPRGTAAAAGLRPGDRVLAIDGLPVAELDARAIVSHLRGPVGSFVRLTVARDGVERTLRVERAPYR